MLILDLITWFVLLILRKIAYIIAFPIFILPTAIIIIGWRKLHGRSNSIADIRKPWIYFNTAQFHSELLKGDAKRRKEIAENIQAIKPYRKNPIWWISGKQAFIEIAAKKLAPRTATDIYNHWYKKNERYILSSKGAIENILQEGSQAEEKANEMIAAVRKQAAGHLKTWTPSDDGLKAIVFPPNEHNSSSQELDQLLVTEAGIYVIEVKGWRKINDDGTGNTRDGKVLGSPIDQCRKKVEAIKKIVGENVRVRPLVILPNLEDTNIPFGLDTRVVTSLAEINMFFRQELRASERGFKYSISNLAPPILRYLDHREDAKMHHMLWLHEHHPNEGTTKIHGLVDERNTLESELLPRIEPKPGRIEWNWALSAIFFPIILWGGIIYSIQRLGVPDRIANLWSTYSAPKPEDTKQYTAVVSDGNSNKRHVAEVQYKQSSSTKPSSKIGTSSASNEKRSFMTSGSKPYDPIWAFSCPATKDHRGMDVCDRSSKGVVFNESGDVVLKDVSENAPRELLKQYCKPGQHIASTGTMGPLLSQASFKRVKSASNAHWQPRQSIVSHSYSCVGFVRQK
ncbi:nuclease-related domain-containing protein [Hydrogenophaga sp. NFH-34]|uniref:nuclease-related domain-containing protein n=1 Tax=Hydrogenophaga sp. NFH-34 TaxID=2744446 RepID=UPI001F41FA83|nr:nuclease-related domain-containing protein [Hydrogenophaga sp. NFH-34]